MKDSTRAKPSMALPNNTAPHSGVYASALSNPANINPTPIAQPVSGTKLIAIETILQAFTNKISTYRILYRHVSSPVQAPSTILCDFGVWKNTTEITKNGAWLCPNVQVSAITTP